VSPETQQTTALISTFMFSKFKYTIYEENWLSQNLTASIQGATKLVKTKYVIHVHFVVQNCIILYCTFYIIIIIIIINCKSLHTHPVETHPVSVVILHITYARTMKVDYSRFSLGRATWEACSGNWERKNGKNHSICCRESYMESM
jgi:hypothetical protein